LFFQRFNRLLEHPAMRRRARARKVGARASERQMERADALLRVAFFR